MRAVGLSDSGARKALAGRPALAGYPDPDKGGVYAQTGLGTVDVISGGFPCQPFSVAGKQRGKEDERFLWPEMCRVIRELRPHCVVGENVPGIIKIAARQVVEDLERAGYHVVVLQFEAAAVGAWHRRARCFFVGIDDLSDAEGLGQQGDGPNGEPERGARSGAEKHEGLRAVCDAMPGRRDRDKRRQKSQELADGRLWAAEPGVGRVADGLPCRVERIRALGNAVVPQQAYPIFRALAEELNRRNDDGY